RPGPAVGKDPRREVERRDDGGGKTQDIDNDGDVSPFGGLPSSPQSPFHPAHIVLQLYLRRKQSLSVMIKPRHGLMSPSPIKPSPNMNQRNNLLPKDFFQEPS